MGLCFIWAGMEFYGSGFYSDMAYDTSVCTVNDTKFDECQARLRIMIP